MFSYQQAVQLVQDWIDNTPELNGVDGFIDDNCSKDHDGVWVIRWFCPSAPNGVTSRTYMVDKETGYLQGVGSRSLASALLNFMLTLERKKELRQKPSDE